MKRLFPKMPHRSRPPWKACKKQPVTPNLPHYDPAIQYEPTILQGFATLRVAKLLVELDRFAEPHVLQNLALFEVV